MALMTNNEKTTTRTFEIKVVVKASTFENINEMLKMKREILNGETQREWKQMGFDKVTATFNEVSNDKQ
jgi:hypothetical protein